MTTEQTMTQVEIGRDLVRLGKILCETTQGEEGLTAAIQQADISLQNLIALLGTVKEKG